MLSQSSAPPPHGDGQEILVVDDEAQVSSFVGARLEHFGYRPTIFNDPRKALAAVAAAPTRFAAIVTDLTMPHLTGLDLLRQARALRPMMPVVILTGYGHELTRGKLNAIPHCLVLQKPFSGDDLARAVHHVVNSSSSSRSPFLVPVPI